MSFSRAVALFANTLVFLLIVAGATPCAAATAYAQMAPLDQYLSASRNAEIELARSAAPPAISQRATILVLTRHGYDTAERGSNGFTCLVERSWTSPFDNAEFWNWKMRGPICYNAPASRTV